MNDNISVNEYEKIMHEVKNPLTICKGYLEILSNNYNISYLDIIKEEINRTLDIINIKKIIEKEEIDVYLLIEDIINIMNPYFKKNNSKIILLDNDKDIYIDGYYSNLKQVIINVLKNSYEARGNEKLIIVIDVREDNNNIVITITDNAVGISEYNLNKFKNEHFTTKEYGDGIGLSNIIDGIKKNNGYIDYYSKKGLGTRVEIFLPKKKSYDFR